MIDVCDVSGPLHRTNLDADAVSIGYSARHASHRFAVEQLDLPQLACQVYAVALYVEAERAAKELGVRKRGGFFDDDRHEQRCDALAFGAQAVPDHPSHEVHTHGCLRVQNGFCHA